MQTNAKWWHLAIFVILCYAVAAFGAQFEPGVWYEGLKRAPWNPPNVAFPIVWTILYAMIAIAGWLIFASNDGPLKLLWSAQLVLNAAWSWLFFGQHWVGVALLDILILLILIGLLVAMCMRKKKTLPGFLLLPYLVWIALATSLNAYIFIYN